MWIQVKFNCGYSIEDAARDMCALADRLGFGVEADFNGVSLMANPRCDAAALVERYRDELRRDGKVKIAFAPQITSRR